MGKQQTTVPSPKHELHTRIGSTEPRIWTPPLRELTPATSYGFEAAEFAKNVLGRTLLPWQEWLMVHAGELLPDGRPRFNFVLILVARQNGKTEIPVMLVPFWMFVEMHPLTLGTSTKLEYAKVSWQKVVTLIENTPDLAAEVPRNGVVRGNNLVQLKTEHDTCYTIAAANRSGGRSLTVSRGIMDEIREHPHYEAHDALVNATNAVYDAQVWAMTNQGDEKRSEEHTSEL